jgi:hypothetical protein
MKDIFMNRDFPLFNVLTLFMKDLVLENFHLTGKQEGSKSRGQRAEGRGQKPAGRGQRAEPRGQRRGKRTDDSRGLEIGKQILQKGESTSNLIS